MILENQKIVNASKTVNADKKKRIKVLIVDGVYPPAYTGSGLRAHRTYTRIAKKAPLKVAVLTMTTGEHEKIVDHFEGVDIYKTNRGKSILLQFIQVGWLMYKYDLKSYHIVHGFGNSIVTIAASIWAKLFGMKLVREMTANPGVHYVKTIKYYLNLIRLYKARNYSIRKADLLISLNSFITKYYKKMGVKSEKIWERPNPVDTTMYTFPNENERLRARSALGIPDSQIAALVIGTISPYKNQQFLTDVIVGLPNYFCFIFVDTEPGKYDDYYRKFQNSIKQAGLNGRMIVYRGFEKDIKKFYHAADILVIPSILEGTPNVMLEALCSGLPVLVNQNLKLNTYVKNGFNGYNVELREAEFIKKIKEIENSLKSPKMRYEISQSAISQFGSERIDAEHFQCLQHIARVDT